MKNKTKLRIISEWFSCAKVFPPIIHTISPVCRNDNEDDIRVCYDIGREYSVLIVIMVSLSLLEPNVLPLIQLVA